MTRHLGDHASTVYVAVIPILSAATHAAPKLFIASLRSLQTMGLPYYAAAAVMALGCAGLAFLAIWLAFRAVTALFAGLGRWIAGAAAAARSGAASLKIPSLRGKTAAMAPAPVAADHSPAESFHPLAEPFVPSWSPGNSPAAAAAPQPEPDGPLPAAAPAHRFPSRPTPASVAAAASGKHERLADLTNPLVQEDVPPGFLYVDTSPLGNAAAPPTPSRTAREVGLEPVSPDVPVSDFPSAAIPFPTRPPSSAPMSIEEAIQFASELQEARDRGALDRMIARGGRPAVAS